MAIKKKSILKTALGYGVGAIGLDLSYGMFYSYLSYYLSSVLGLQEGFLLLITPLARIWDGINDPMMGTIVDNTRTKHGKYRPWILIGAMCNAVVLFLLFTSFGMSGLPLYIYIGIMYVLWGMTNTMADIPYWSMVPSFTSEEKERNLVATVARTFSGIGQGIISILTPWLCPLLSSGITDEKGYSASGFSRWAGICGIALVFFALICVLVTKETNVVYGEKKKFSLKQIFDVIKSNDQLVVFIVFAMLSNAGWYLTSSTAVYYFTDSLGDSKLQSTFQLIGTVGSVLGLLVVPVLSTWFTKRKTYTISLCTAIAGYALMLITGPILKLNVIIMDVCYILASVGVSSMFVSQTIFLADIVDYGEYKNGVRNESITFSMKGFLQKMAYTLQTIILFSSLGIANYDGELHNQNPQSAKVAITLMLCVIPIALFIISLVIFTKKFKLHGAYMDEVTAIVTENRNKREANQAE